MRTGAQRLVLGLGSALKNLGHEVAYFTSLYDKDSAFQEFASEMVFSSGGRRKTFGSFRALTAFRASGGMVEYGIQKFSPDLYVFSSNYYLAARFKPSIIYCHFPERLLVKRGDLIRRILHYPIDRAERRGFRKADEVVCNSRFTGEAVFELFGRRCLVSYPGVDLNKFNYSPDDDGFVLTVNRIMPNKNLELGIDSIASLKEKGISTKFVIAGTVQRGFEWYLEEVKKKIEEKRLVDSISIKTNVPDSELLELYRRCAIFLYTPTLEHYGFGPVEAMASGKPVIASSQGGPSETVIDGQTGFVVPPRIDEWASRIGELLANRELRIQMGQLARRRVEESFTWEKFSEVMTRALGNVFKTG